MGGECCGMLVSDDFIHALVRLYGYEQCVLYEWRYGSVSDAEE